VRPVALHKFRIELLWNTLTDLSVCSGPRVEIAQGWKKKRKVAAKVLMHLFAKHDIVLSRSLIRHRIG